MKKTVFFAGNIILGYDNKPHLLIPHLREKFPQIDFLHYDPTEELPENFPGKFILIDTVAGIKEATVFHNLNNFSPSPHVTLHDYDVLLNLKLMIKLKKIKEVVIIGLPQEGKLADFIGQTEEILKTI